VVICAAAVLSACSSKVDEPAASSESDLTDQEIANMSRGQICTGNGSYNRSSFPACKEWCRVTEADVGNVTGAISDWSGIIDAILNAFSSRTVNWDTFASNFTIDPRTGATLNPNFAAWSSTASLVACGTGFVSAAQTLQSSFSEVAETCRQGVTRECVSA